MESSTTTTFLLEILLRCSAALLYTWVVSWHQVTWDLVWRVSEHAWATFGFSRNQFLTGSTLVRSLLGHLNGVHNNKLRKLNKYLRLPKNYIRFKTKIEIALFTHTNLQSGLESELVLSTHICTKRNKFITVWMISQVYPRVRCSTFRVKFREEKRGRRDAVTQVNCFKVCVFMFCHRYKVWACTNQLLLKFELQKPWWMQLLLCGPTYLLSRKCELIRRRTGEGSKA